MSRWTPGQPRRTPADEAGTELGVLLLAHAHRQHPDNRLAAIEAAFEILLNHVRAIASISPRTLAETQDHINHLRELDDRRREAAGEPRLELVEPETEVSP